jgi:hypothetical protein
MLMSLNLFHTVPGEKSIRKIYTFMCKMSSGEEESCCEEEDYEEEEEEETEEEPSYSHNDPHEEQFDSNFNDLRDLYNIHRTNESAYDMISSNPQILNSEGTDMLKCPICDEWHHISDVSGHMMNQHSGLYISLIVLMNPSINIHNVSDVISNYYALRNNMYQDRLRAYSTIQNLMFQEDDETPSYEDLLDLCNHIGYHKPGIENIDAVSSILTKEEQATDTKEDDTCRICLESLRGQQDLRKIKKCSHIFCGECIQTWLTENKTCPLCNVDVSAPSSYSLEDPD